MRDQEDKTATDEVKSSVSFNEITENNSGQRIDNYLLSLLKGVPKSRIYKIVRKGEVRVNKGRVKPDYKLKLGDTVRVPPVRVAQKQDGISSLPGWVREALQTPIFEDEHIIALNKPSGLAVHGGSGNPYGVIEAMRFLYPEWPFLELAHRIDRQTSGCLLLAKSRPILNELHTQFRREGESAIEKTYLAILTGDPLSEPKTVEAEIGQARDAEGLNKARIDSHGQTAKSVFMPLESVQGYSVARIALYTGRMHQARVHAAFLNRPIIGDSLYGNWQVNKAAERHGVKRCMLHSETYQFKHPGTGKTVKLKAPISEDFALAKAALINQ
ncbi:MAG: 23S rRNA pseudouridine955/2504/2580 synthase [Saprospiraceae bacterium]|jgi:23S rRNA pseudouridine955/2504/2580 synthase